MPAAGRMTLARAETTYFVPREAAFALRRRGEAAFAQLGAALDEVLAPVLPPDDARVWIIRRLHVDLAFAADVDDVRALAHVWASEIARSLVRTLRDGDEVIHFDGRPAFLAQFVADAAAGRDLGCWYYETFASLRALPRAGIIRETIVREPEHAAAVLFELARTRRLEPVLAALSGRGAREVCEAAFPSSDALLSPSTHMVEVLRALAGGLAVRDDGGSLATPQNAIRLCVAMHELSPSAGLAEVRAHVEFFLRLAAAQPDLVTRAAGTHASAAAARPARVPSAFAGLALLLQPLAEMEVETGRELRKQIAARCAAGAKPVEVLCDPVIELFAGPEDGEDEPEEVDGERAAELARELMAKFAARLLSFGGSSEAFLYANFIEGTGALRYDAEMTVIELPPVPLAIVLQLTGVHGRRFTVPWLPDRTLELRLGGSS